MQETQVRSLGGEDHLKKGRATHSSIFAWEIPWTEEPGGLQSMGLQSVGHTEQLTLHFPLKFLSGKCSTFNSKILQLTSTLSAQFCIFSWLPESKANMA